MAEIDTNVTEVATETTNVEAARETESSGNAELERLKAEIAKQKLALDKATSEAASMKKQLRAKQTAVYLHLIMTKALAERYISI